MFKRLVSLVVVFVIVVSACVVPTFATEKEYKYKHLLPESEHYLNYDEVYYHYVDENDPNSDIDWAIIFCEFFAFTPAPTSRIVLDRVIVSGNIYAYYPVMWAIYDAELNEVISIDKIDVDKYDGLEEGLEEANVGNPFGDADLDGMLNVMDATYIQRALANLCEFKEYDRIQGYPWGVQYDRPLNYISDIDGDGNRTIMDATAIQVKLAKK